MKAQQRWISFATLLLIAYIAAYYLSVESVNSGIYRTVDGRWPKPAVYAIGRDVTIGKVRRYSMDGISHPFFFRLTNWIGVSADRIGWNQPNGGKINLPIRDDEIG